MYMCMLDVLTDWQYASVIWSQHVRKVDFQTGIIRHLSGMQLGKVRFQIVVMGLH